MDTTHALPSVIRTTTPIWQRWWSRFVERRSAVPSVAGGDVEWDALRDLSPSLQRDIGLPEALREHARALRERDAMWLRV